MLKPFSPRHWILATIAASALGCFGLGCFVSPSNAAGAPEGLKGTPEAGSLVVLPALSNPRPVRQGVVVQCNVNNPSIGNNLCITVFGPVPAGRVLEISVISCLAGTAGTSVGLFNTQLAADAIHTVAYFPIEAGTSIASGRGPFYFKAGERPKLLSIASSPTTTAFCSIEGTLWQAN